MSSSIVFTSDESVIKIENNNTVSYVELYKKPVEDIVIRNCNNLREVNLSSNIGLNITIESCKNLEIIRLIRLPNKISKSIYIGKGVNGLKILDISNVEEVIIDNQDFYNLFSVNIEKNIKKLQANFSRFYNIKYLSVNVDIISDVVINSNNLESFSFCTNCISSIVIKGKTNYLKILNIVCKRLSNLKFENDLPNIKELVISVPDYKTPYTHLTNNKDIMSVLNKKTTYDNCFIEYIETV